MPRALFICTANQFRSPIAEALFKRNLAIKGKESDWLVESAGTWATPDLPAHPKAIEAAAKVGIDLSNHRTREVNLPLLLSTDLIIVMQNSHKEALEAEFPTLQGQIFLLGQLAKISGGDIPDPALDGFAHSDATVKLIRTCINRAFSIMVQYGSKRPDVQDT